MNSQITTSLQNAPTGIQLWLTGIRPRTLTIAASPVVAAAGLTYYDLGSLNWLVLLVTLVSALAIQAGTNLLNDAADGETGTDTSARVGPPRLTAQGWATPGQVKRTAFACFAFAALGGLYLVLVGGWLILLAGIISIACGMAYSLGPVPLSRTPFSEVFVIIFFGIIATLGTYYLQTGNGSANAVVAGLAIGLFGAAVLMVNNIRDFGQDISAGRKTLAITIGKKSSQFVYATLVLVPFALQLAFEMTASGHGNWLPVLPAPFAAFLAGSFFKSRTALQFNTALVQTAKLQFAFSMLYCLGLITLKLGQLT
jgi:1,4-dihydroxy-2-naphthoate octaprenyltransferase